MDGKVRRRTSTEEKNHKAGERQPQLLCQTVNNRTVSHIHELVAQMWTMITTINRGRLMALESVCKVGTSAAHT